VNRWSTGNGGGVLQGSLQALHIHVLLVASLGADHMAQPDTDQHEGRVTVRETAPPASLWSEASPRTHCGKGGSYTARLSQTLCKPPMWCRIEAPHWRFYIWPERIVSQKKMPGERKSVNCCRGRVKIGRVKIFSHFSLQGSCQDFFAL